MSEPRKFSEVKAERAESDPEQRRRTQVMGEIMRLEAEASGSGNVAERNRLQCEAEELRTMLYHDYLVPEKMA